METQLSCPKCDIFCILRSPESTEDPAYIAEQVDRIERHIRELNELKNNLLRRANHIQSPLYTMPFEVLSRIFSHIIDDDSDLYRNWRPAELERDWTPKRLGLRQILTLTSISFHLRQVALETPELWKQMLLELDNITAIRCSPYAEISSLLPDPSLQIKEADRISAALSSDIMHRVRVLRLQLSSGPISLVGSTGKRIPGWWDPRNWEPTASAFPALTTLDIHIQGHFSALRLHALPLSRLDIHAPDLQTMTVPASLQVLSLGRLSDNITESILYDCPNLTECINNNYHKSALPSRFSRPLTLAHLKRLVWPVEVGLSGASSVKNLKLPALKYLTVCGGPNASMEGVVKLCRRLSATLTNLTLMRSSRDGWTHLDPTLLFQTSLPRLRYMALSPPDVPAVIRALAECDYSTCFPSLDLVKLRGFRDHTDPDFVPPDFVQLLEEQKKSGSVCLKLDMRLEKDQWTTELRQKLMLVMGDGRVKIVYEGKDIEWLESS
jgi:hypothetical protein